MFVRLICKLHVRKSKNYCAKIKTSIPKYHLNDFFLTLYNINLYLFHYHYTHSNIQIHLLHLLRMVRL